MATESNDEAAPEEAPDAEADLTYDVSSDERTWGVLTHAAAFAGFAVPFGNVLGPLLIWLVKRDESRFLDANGKQAVNFQITWTIWIGIALLTLLIGIGLLIVPVVMLAWLIFVVLAMIRASEDQVYDYPLTIDLVS